MQTIVNALNDYAYGDSTVIAARQRIQDILGRDGTEGSEMIDSALDHIDTVRAAGLVDRLFIAMSLAIDQFAADNNNEAAAHGANQRM